MVNVPTECLEAGRWACETMKDDDSAEAAPEYGDGETTVDEDDRDDS
ncbi:hypothetical protein [Halorussus halophilus]|nr:hypothetical protein [Halorussus halophilus]